MPTGGTKFTDVPVTVPTPLLMLNDVAPVTSQESVVDCPAASAAGMAVKLLTTGGGTTVIDSELVVVPTALVRVNV